MSTSSGKVAVDDDADLPVMRKSQRISQSKQRTIRWAAYAKDHLAMNFENVPAKFQPAMFENRHGLALYLEKIDGWRLPKSVYEQVGKGKVHLSLQLSLSLFHVSSGTFFGTTWMGPRISLSDPDKAFTKDVELQFKEMIYLVSRINDETCVGVVEIVVGREDDSVNLTTGQYGCGWTMLNIFNKNVPPDCSDRRDEVKLLSCPIFAGSPRDLVMNPNIDTLAKSLKEVPDCYLFFKVYSHRRLLKLQRHVAENEVIGRYDAIPGLIYREVVPPNHTRGMLIPCLGDEEVAQRDGIHVFPARPKMVMYSTLKIADGQLFLPRRDAVEVRMIESVLSIFPRDKQKEVKVLQRLFKFGLHNGHAILGELQVQPLVEDQEDHDILLTQDPVLTVFGYAPDQSMAIVCSIEYLIGIPAPKLERTDPKELIRTSQHLDLRPLMSTAVTLGCAVYIPSDGYQLHLKNVKAPPPGSQEEGLNIELNIDRGDVCKYITPVPLANLKDPSKTLVSLAAEDKTSDDLRRSLAAKSSTAKSDTKAGGRGDAKQQQQQRVMDSYNQSSHPPAVADSKTAATATARDSVSRMFTVNQSTVALPELDKDSIPILGFDLKVLHPKRGELKHEDDIRSLLTLVEKDATPALGEEDGPPTIVDQAPDKKDAKDTDAAADDSKRDRDDSPSSRRSLTRRGGSVVLDKERPRRRGRRANGDDDDDDDASSTASESLVGGDSYRNGLRLDPFFYTGGALMTKPAADYAPAAADRRSVRSASSDASDALGDRQYHRRSQLAQKLLHAKFTPRRVDGGIAAAWDDGADGSAASRYLDRQVSQSDLYLARKTTVPMMRNDFFLRTISRGAKSRLNRYGIHDAMRDTAMVAGGEHLPPQYQHLQLTHGRGAAALTRLMQQQGAVDLDLEARDELSVHEISLQFAGFRYGPPPDNAALSKSPAILSVPQPLAGPNGRPDHAPRAVYFSYQFFTCQPTRTEAMKLTPTTEPGQVSVLVRDTVRTNYHGMDYDEPALVLRYIIDCTRSSPFEAVEFAEYLADKSLYIDVWDADSLLPIGTYGIPLRMLMRQGALSVKHAIECDVINYETVAPVHGGITSMTIMEGGPISGELVGSVQMIISNYGVRGRGKHRPSSRPIVPIDGLNWRMMQPDEQRRQQQDGGRMMPNELKLRRPKTSVVARPLAATAPELQKALQDLRESNGVTGPPVSYRSLLAQGRDHGGGMVSTLNYDEVVLLFRRFQGLKKGTVQYTGPLLQLMDLPSTPITLRKIAKLFKLYGDALAFRNALLQHANAAEYLKREDIEECVRVMADRSGLKFKPEERTLLARKMLATPHAHEQMISVSEAVSFISAEADRQDWVTVSKRLRTCAQKAELDGYDVAQMLAEYDVEGKQSVPTRSFRDFLLQVGKFGTLTQHDVHVACRTFARHGRGLDDRDPVSCTEVMAAFGRKYVGNLQARVRQIIHATHAANADAAAAPLDAKHVLRLLNATNGTDAGTAVLPPGQYTHAQVEHVFRALGVFTELSHAQVKYLLAKLDVRGQGVVSAAQVLTYLGLAFRASDLPTTHSQLSSAASAYHFDYDSVAPPVSTAGPVIDAEYILKLLLQQAQSNGVQIDQVFRHFDTNGDGSISRDELVAGMQKLALFDGVPNWTQQIPAIVRKFDVSGDGLVSLREFFTFLGIKDYAPNIVQRLTKIFSVATEKGLSFEVIFRELDSDQTGTIDAQELAAGLVKLGTFDRVTPGDIQAVLQQFDRNGDGKIARDEFIAFFTERVAQDKKMRKQQAALRVAKRFRDVMRVAQAKGARLEQIFAHLDRDQGGSVSTTELAEALSKMPNFKSISKEELQLLLSEIDTDASGDVTLSEFESFVNNAEGGGSAVELLPAPKDTVQLLRETFGAAIAKGLSLEKEFALVDADGSGRVSFKEFETIVRKLPSFRSVAVGEVQRVFDAIDVDRSGMVTPDEFGEFVRTGQVSFERSKQRKQAQLEKLQQQVAQQDAAREELKRQDDGRGGSGGGSARHEGKDNGGDGDGDGSGSRDDVQKERFIRHVRRIAEIDGSVRSLLAYLDDDEDGLIAKRRFVVLLRREGVFESVPERDVDLMLKPFERTRATVATTASGERRDSSDRGGGYDSKSGGGDASGFDADERFYEVVPLLHFVEHRKYQPRTLADLDDEDEALTREMLQEKDYAFSKDPEVCAVERKLRHFGRLLARNGVDVEQEFQLYDAELTGMVLRTEFIKVLGKIGMFLLEEGHILRDQSHQERNGHNRRDPMDVVRQRQLQQIKQLKGAQGMFVQQAPNLARKLSTLTPRNGPSSSEFKNHLESLTVIDWYRQGQKQHLIQNVLSHSLAHTIYLYPRFGKTLFFEYPITNPFGHEERFVIDVPDGELRLITSIDEWLFCRRCLRPCVGELGGDPVESDLFDRDPASGHVSVTLLPFETLYIPFTFMTLIPFRPLQKSPSTALVAASKAASHPPRRDAGDYKDGDERKAASRDGDGDGDENDDRNAEDDAVDALLQRVVSTKIISASHGHIVAILKVIVSPRPYVVHRVLRLYEYEHAIAKRKIKLVGLSGASSSAAAASSARGGIDGVHAGDFPAHKKFLHCVETTSPHDAHSTRAPQEAARVVVEWGTQLRALARANPLYHKDPEYLSHHPANGAAHGTDDVDDLHALDLLIRYRVGEAPSCGVFHLLVYDDPFQCQLHEVWQVMVHSRLRLDVHGTVGAVSAADLVIRGDQYPRRVQAFALPSPFFHLSFKPSAPMQLVPNAYNRILTCIQPKVSGSQRRALIHVVDNDSSKLMAAYLVSISAGIPAVMRSYDVEVPVNKAVFKKILFTNPWDSRRRYRLTSSDEDVMRPRGDALIDIGPGGTAYLRLWFAGWRGGDVGVKEVHLFLNDADHGGSEEAHLFRVMEASAY